MRQTSNYYLPTGTRIAHKTGYVDDIRTDAGMVELDTGLGERNNRLGESDTSVLLYCVMTHDNVDRGSSSQNDADLMIGEIGRIAYQAFRNRGPVVAPGLVQTLRTGSRGDWVDGLQRTLNGRLQSSPNMSVDGAFGPDTDSSVRRFQTENSLPSSGLVAGEQLSVGQMLSGLMLPSGNEASVALAEHLGGRVLGEDRGEGTPDFIAAMNTTGTQLGMLQTTYENTHGWTSKGHLTTAADFAILAKAAMQLPHFREIVGTARFECRVGCESGYQRDVTWKNTNRLLGYEGFTGITTGTTNTAGCCLVASGTHDGQELIVVVLGSTSSDARYIDARNLFRYGWSKLGSSD